MTERQFRFGVLTKGAPTRSAWLDLLAEVEGCGFDSLLIPAHATPQFSQSAALADVAARTALKIGTLVANNDLQHPVLLARDAATLDLLSDGRLELGIGAGWMARDYTQLGLPMRSGRERAGGLAEAVSIMRSCWTGEEFGFHGKHYVLTGVRGLASRRIPIMIGAGGTRMLALAADVADTVSISRDLGAGSSVREIALDSSLSVTVRKVSTLNARLSARSIELNILAPKVEIGKCATERVSREATTTGLSIQDVLDTPENWFAESTAEMAERLYERRARTGISYYVVRDEHVRQVAPVVATLAKTTK